MGISLDQWQAITRVNPELMALHPDSPSRQSQYLGGKPGCWRITVPGWQPTPANQLIGCHWATAYRRKCRDVRAIRPYCGHVPAARGKRRVSIAITLRKGQKSFDPDAPWKSTLDALVVIGLLVDDNPRYVELGPVEFSRAKDAETTLELEDL